MERLSFPFPDVALFRLARREDGRGAFWESWREAWRGELGVAHAFVQENVSVSKRGVLRGMHHQDPVPQGKLITVLRGEIFDVVVDVRPESANFGKWAASTLNEETSLFVPRGYAHGFYVLSEEAVVSYKVDAPYAPDCERLLRWDDPDLGIGWPIREVERPILSERDAAAPRWRDTFPI